MSQATDPTLGINSWLEDELYHQYRFDRKSVDEGWTRMFQDPGHNGSTAAVAELPNPPRSAAVPPQEPEPPVEEPPTEEPVIQEPPAPEPVPQEAPGASSSRTAGSDPELPASPPEPARAVEITKSVPPEPVSKSVGASDQLIPLRGVAARIVENMTASLEIPVATSYRQIPVRVIEENRNTINKYRAPRASAS